MPFDPDDEDRNLPPRHGHGSAGDDLVRHASELMGYDVRETKIIEANAEFHTLVVERVSTATSGKRIPAEKVFGSLDDDE